MMKDISLFTDLYELTMAQGFYFKKKNEKAVFDMFFRRAPFNGGFTVFAGLEPLIEAIESLRFSDEHIDYLKSLGMFEPDFLAYLEDFKFQGDFYSVSEGQIVFPNEPLIRVHGNLIECQLLESLLLNIINFQSLIATKSSRIYIASKQGNILEFGLRRSQGFDGALSAARAAFIGGASATSNVLAGQRFGIPVKGTMTHSWIMSFESELEAFEQYADLYPNNCILLVDTYDVLNSGIPNALKVFETLKQKGINEFGIRLDSGDLEYQSKEARKIFEKAGFPEVKIIVSNELDENVIHQLISNGSPIDAWGVGTKLVTGDSDPALSGVYKIAARQSEGRYYPSMKITNNPEKMSNPGIKNVYRFFNSNGKMIADLVYLEQNAENLEKRIAANEPVRLNHPNIEYANITVKEYSRAEKLLKPMIEKGERLHPVKKLSDIQNTLQEELSSLDETYKRLINPHVYKVSISDLLKELKGTLISERLDNL